MAVDFLDSLTPYMSAREHTHFVNELWAYNAALKNSNSSVDWHVFRLACMLSIVPGTVAKRVFEFIPHRMWRVACQGLLNGDCGVNHQDDWAAVTALATLKRAIPARGGGFTSLEVYHSTAAAGVR